MKNRTGTLDDGLDGALRETVGLWAARRDCVMPPSQSAAGFEKLAGVVRANVHHVVGRSDEVKKGGPGGIGVLVNGRVRHEEVSEFAENNKSACVAIFVGGGVFTKDSAVSRQSVAEAFGDRPRIECPRRWA